MTESTPGSNEIVPFDTSLCESLLDGEVALLYFSDTQAFFGDADGLIWRLDFQDDSWRPIDVRDLHPMRFQFQTAKHSERTTFDNKEDAFVALKMQLFIEDVQEKISEFEQYIASGDTEEQLAIEIKEALVVLHSVWGMIQQALAGPDEVQKREMLVEAYNVYRESQVSE